MGLQDVEGKRLTATKLEKGEHVRHARESMNPKTFEKICRTIDEAIEDTVSKKGAKLVWLNTGSLVGDRATLPHASHQHLWQAIYDLFPSTTDPVAVKHQRITVGSIIKWRVALRPEDWLVHYRPTERVDIVTGEKISASEYWIKPPEVPLAPPTRTKPKSNKITVEDLAKHFKPR